jgi:hypothetical protein
LLFKWFRGILLNLLDFTDHLHDLKGLYSFAYTQRTSRVSDEQVAQAVGLGRYSMVIQLIKEETSYEDKA